MIWLNTQNIGDLKLMVSQGVLTVPGIKGAGSVYMLVDPLEVEE